MYSYQSAMVREFGKQGRWVEADLSQTIVSSLYRDYEGVYLVLTHEVLPEPVALDMAAVRTAFGASGVDLTVTDWLASLGKASLPTIDDVPEVNTQYCDYRDAWAAGYSIDPVSKTAHWSVDLPKDERPDLRLTRENAQYERLYRECLVSVNGLYHLTNLGADALYVDDGAKSGFLANANQVGLFRLGVLGDIECVPITAEMIAKNRPEQKLADYAYLHLDRDLEGKTVLLVLGGYLHVLEQSLKRTGPQTFRLDFNNLPYVERFFQSRKLIDLSAMEALMERAPNNPDQFLLEELYSDAVITEYLTLSQSFFVIVDTPELFVERRQVESTGLPGRFIAHNYPTFPLITTLGRMPEYWVIEEDGQYVVAVHDNLDIRYNFETYQYKDTFTVDPTRLTVSPYDYSDAYFLVVGKDL